MEELLAEIEAFRAKHSMSVSAFGSLALGDHKFLSDLQDGRSPSLKTADRVRSFMREYEPAQAAA